MTYWGEEVFTAEPLTIAQVEPSLPPLGTAGVVDILEVVEGRLREQLLDPSGLLRPPEEWPAQTPTARTQLRDPQEWEPLAKLLVARRLVDWIPASQVFSPFGKPVVNGLFGVPKPKKLPESDLSVLRLICNLVPSNKFFYPIQGEVEDLPYIFSGHH